MLLAKAVKGSYNAFELRCNHGNTSLFPQLTVFSHGEMRKEPMCPAAAVIL